ncbi:hypothetical protein C8J38_11317 [Rhizobium sp. PP-WC-2G-219]|uniref:hypothetical protein n=1 Tax=Rhizobium sp. PP-CC-3G-465 TaxID=2135648 RepID=UPI000D9EE58C|nr:hypothetical protein C8J37_11511 [Rhizobium sp. PP-WC-1G-195]PYE39545.1 hypothetical protein DFI02_1239 [Rhizobium sp. PP-F2F-G20b]TCL89402.1 hypothetical protein C8J38_11317 [Rhizobium sp. PP-WC-2G-219]TCP77790.1 hypothetical protein C8J31_12315 [Rhizobium sp. PP-CC-2G-626]TCQ01524.1 hypothetical protein C8J34_1301 [Rhizobium sp. PP-F2F-G36]TCQ14502.1 hypothetical protein C8J33_1251 [Rhizobium sp. PP-CC-3G-465]
MTNGPSSDLIGPDRALKCQEKVNVPVTRLIDDAVLAGWRTTEVFDALEEIIRNRRLSYAEDAGAADAPSEISMTPGLDGATANL